MGVSGSMPLMDEVILTEDYQTGTSVLDSISNRTIFEDLEVTLGEWRHGFGARGLSVVMVTFSCQLV